MSKGITYPSIDDPSMRTLLSISGLPTGAIPLTIALDKHGRVAQIWLRIVQQTELEAVVRALGAES